MCTPGVILNECIRELEQRAIENTVPCLGKVNHQPGAMLGGGGGVGEGPGGGW